MLGVSYDAPSLSFHAVCLVDLLRYGPYRIADCFDFSGQGRGCSVSCDLPRSELLLSGDIGSELRPSALRVCRARFLYLVFALKTPFASTLSPVRFREFEREALKWLIRLGGLGGVW